MSVQGLLYSYSEKNKQLILEQLPDASIVMSKSKWRELGRFPSTDSKGIEIVRPEVIDGTKTGQLVKSTVYDISQTYGRQIKKSEIAVTLKERSSELASEITRITKSSPVLVEVVKILKPTAYMTNHSKRYLSVKDYPK